MSTSTAALRPRPRRRRPAADAVFLAPLLIFFTVACAVAQPGPHPTRDEPDLLAAAARILTGHLVPTGHVVDPRAYLWHGPGLIALLAPFVALHVPLPVTRFLDPVLLGCAAVLFHRLLRLRLGRNAALGWTYAFGLYVPFLSVITEVHKEPLAILLVVAAMAALTRGLSGGGRLALVAAGLALGALAMVRLEYGWVAIALLAIALLRWGSRRHDGAARRLTLVPAVAVLTCVPWLAYTYSLTGHALYWGSSSGESLYWMSPTLPGETGQWHSPGAIETDPALAPLRPPFVRLDRLDPVRRDLELRRQAAASVRARPALFARNLVANVGRLFWSVPMRPRRSLLRTGADVLFNSLLLAALAWATTALWRRRRDLPPETGAIAVFAAVAIAAHLPASASPRMLLPVVPALLWLIAQAGAAAARSGVRGEHEALDRDVRLDVVGA